MRRTLSALCVTLASLSPALAHAKNACREAVRTDAPGAKKACYERSPFHHAEGETLGAQRTEREYHRFRVRADLYQIARERSGACDAACSDRFDPDQSPNEKYVLETVAEANCHGDNQRFENGQLEFASIALDDLAAAGGVTVADLTRKLGPQAYGKIVRKICESFADTRIRRVSCATPFGRFEIGDCD